MEKKGDRWRFLSTCSPWDARDNVKLTVFNAVDVRVELVDGSHTVLEIAVTHVRVNRSLRLGHGRCKQEGVHGPRQVLWYVVRGEVRRHRDEKSLFRTSYEDQVHIPCDNSTTCNDIVCITSRVKDRGINTCLKDSKRLCFLPLDVT